VLQCIYTQNSYNSALACGIFELDGGSLVAIFHTVQYESLCCRGKTDTLCFDGQFRAVLKCFTVSTYLLEEKNLFAFCLWRDVTQSDGQTFKCH